ncbi:MAG: SAM-dependent methyltransferase [Pseudomonadota bacterium]
MPLSDIAKARSFFARLMAGASASMDPRFEQIVKNVPREAFMGPGPWKIVAGRTYVETPDSDPAYLYQNVLIGLDPDRGINNGEPFLHARWLGCVAPQPGDSVSHIGAGTGYYTALLSKFVSPGGHVDAYEVDEGLAELARKNLEAYPDVKVFTANAVVEPLHPSDVIYVNAGVAALPAAWLKALKPGGRMIFPWRPSKDMGLALLVTATTAGLDAMPLMPVWFIPCIGAEDVPDGAVLKNPGLAWKVRSIRWNVENPADESAVAVCDDFWFSTEPVLKI